MFKPKRRSCFFNFAFIPVLIISFLLLNACSFSVPTTFLSTLSQSKVPNIPHPFPVVVVDAGHGGDDPGKIGTAGTLEKEINLKIALYLKEILEAQNIKVIMTRELDKDLSTDPHHFKISDMKNRISLIEECSADMVISIHQNSYPSPQVCGAQCFYYTNSEESRILASLLQEQIIQSTNQTKIREIKENSDYYLLKHSPVPTVITECGFLSNPEEEQLLSEETYQRKMAWAISLGVLQFLNLQQ